LSQESFFLFLVFLTGFGKKIEKRKRTFWAKKITALLLSRGLIDLRVQSLKGMCENGSQRIVGLDLDSSL
jgi:hypothetical protein